MTVKELIKKLQEIEGHGQDWTVVDNEDREIEKVFIENSLQQVLLY